MFQNAKCYVVAQDFRKYLKQNIEASEEQYALTYTDIAQYADCPARWHASKNTLEEELSSLDRIVSLASADPQAFEKAYAVPPATVQTPTLVCGRCGSTSTAKLCTDCNLIRNVQNLAVPYCPTSKAGKAWKDRALKTERIPLTPANARRAIGAANAIKKDAAFAALCDGAERLVAIDAEWHCGAGSRPVPIRVLIDALPKQWSDMELSIIAVVACRTAHPIPFAIHSYRRGLHIRAALEIDLCNAANLAIRSQYLLAAVESEAPHVVARRMLTGDAIVAGRQVYEQALTNYAVSLQTKYWPDYDMSKKDHPGWSLVDPEGALHNQALALVGTPLAPTDPDASTGAEPATALP